MLIGPILSPRFLNWRGLRRCQKNLILRSLTGPHNSATQAHFTTDWDGSNQTFRGTV